MRFNPQFVLGAVIPLLGVVVARASTGDLFAFPTVLVPVGNGVVQLHLPLVGFAFAAICGWLYGQVHAGPALPAALWAVAVFGATHVLAVLGFQWEQGVYRTIFESGLTSPTYLVVGRLYVASLFTCVSVASVWLAAQTIRDQRSARRVAPEIAAATAVIPVSGLLVIALVMLGYVAAQGFWAIAAVTLVCESLGLWFHARYSREVGSWSAILRRRVSPRCLELGVFTSILIVAFVVRYYWGMRLLSGVGSDYLVASDDAPSYHLLATKIASGVRPVLEDASRWGGILYWYFLGAIYRIAGISNFGAIILVQAALGVVVPATTYVIARTVFESRRIAAVSALLCALNVLLIFLSGVIGMEALYLPLFYASLAALVLIITRDACPWPACVATGILFGLANMARAEVFGYPILLLAITIVLAMRHIDAERRFAATRDVRLMLLVGSGFLITWTAQGLVNWIAYDQVVVTSYQAIVGFSTTKLGISENTALDALGFNPFVDLLDSGRAFLEQPIAVAHLLVVGFVKRLYTFLLLPGAGVFDPLTLTISGRIHDFFPEIRVSFSSLVEAYSIVFAFVGFVALARVRHRLHGIVLSVWVGYAMFLNVFVGVKSARHRAVLVPILIICLVKGIDLLIQRLYSARSVREKGRVLPASR